MPRPRPRSIAGAVLGDARGDGRALRVTWHAEAGVVVLSIWKDNLCTATVRLTPDEVGPLVETLQRGLPAAAVGLSAS
ncbi:hypothetical protein SAMN04487968_11460 [Nocardioides terrae]|uniref:Uncharacterized protein n=1 Tax=Nocardioides terrae TaxID=574651 RepID=A0A1I1N3Q1_9ACTN|nr:hypothetical protein [Nocardioides terrae]SFC91832.1 hypothetical protein SAMN04487968_11460 [Nocardioides terrae]